MGADGTKEDGPLAILIEELKNENIQTRINAIRRIQTIAKALGPEKTRSKLLTVLQGMFYRRSNAESFSVAI